MCSCCYIVNEHKKNITLPENIIKDCCFYAIQSNHLDCLEYFHKNNICWDENVINIATYLGNLDCLKYTHETKEFTNIAIPCYDFNYNIESNSIYMQERKSCYQFLIEKGYSYGTNENNFKHMFNDDEWFNQLNSLNHYIKTGEVNEYTFHINNKIKKFQKKWLEYSHNPTTKIGYSRMMNTIYLNELLLEGL